MELPPSLYRLTLHRAARGTGRVIGATVTAPTGETFTFDEPETEAAIRAAREAENSDPWDGGKLPSDDALIRALMEGEF